MPRKRFNVVYTGAKVQGRFFRDLAARYKARRNSSLPRKNTVVLANVDYPAAAAAARRLERAGGGWRIEQMPVPNAPPKAPPPLPNDPGSRPVALALEPAHPDVHHSPRTVRRLDKGKAGLAVHLVDLPEILFEDLRLVSVVSDGLPANSVLKMLLILQGRPRPLAVRADAIRYADFKETAQGRLADSLRAFVAFLCGQKAGLAMDAGTRDFVSGGRAPAAGNVLEHATSLFHALDQPKEASQAKGGAGGTATEAPPPVREAPAAQPPAAALAGARARAAAGVQTLLWMAAQGVALYFFLTRALYFALPELDPAEVPPWFPAVAGAMALGLAFSNTLLAVPARRGQTMGQWLAGIRVVPARGGPLDNRAWALRAAASLATAATFVTAPLWLTFSARGNSLADRLSGTLQAAGESTPHPLWQAVPAMALAAALGLLFYGRDLFALLPPWVWAFAAGVAAWAFLIYGFRAVKRLRP
ncbi:MAG: RDD family protein [Deltaproteobacteria bacterium]|nr:RDD family protein [Deltaproteobacteria bacterium]